MRRDRELLASTARRHRRPICGASRRPTATEGYVHDDLPGLVPGRATHIHIEVVRNGASVKVTQIAFPESVNNAVYGTGVYAPRQ